MGVGCSSFFACPGQQPRSSAPRRNRLTSHSSGRLRRRLIQALGRRCALKESHHLYDSGACCTARRQHRHIYLWHAPAARISGRLPRWQRRWPPSLWLFHIIQYVHVLGCCRCLLGNRRHLEQIWSAINMCSVSPNLALRPNISFKRTASPPLNSSVRRQRRMHQLGGKL